MVAGLLVMAKVLMLLAFELPYLSAVIVTVSSTIVYISDVNVTIPAAFVNISAGRRDSTGFPIKKASQKLDFWDALLVYWIFILTKAKFQ
jgi:hypothetical protein